MIELQQYNVWHIIKGVWFHQGPLQFKLCVYRNRKGHVVEYIG